MRWARHAAHSETFGELVEVIRDWVLGTTNSYNRDRSAVFWAELMFSLTLAYVDVDWFKRRRKQIVQHEAYIALNAVTLNGESS